MIAGQGGSLIGFSNSSVLGFSNGSVPSGGGGAVLVEQSFLFGLSLSDFLVLCVISFLVVVLVFLFFWRRHKINNFKY